MMWHVWPDMCQGVGDGALVLPGPRSQRVRVLVCEVVPHPGGRFPIAPQGILSHGDSAMVVFDAWSLGATLRIERGECDARR